MKRTMIGLAIGLVTFFAIGLVWWRPSLPPHEHRGWALLIATTIIGLVGYRSAGSVPSGQRFTVAIRSTGMFGWAVGAVAYVLLVKDLSPAYALYAFMPIVYVGLFRASEIEAKARDGMISTKRADSLILLVCTLFLLWADRQQMVFSTVVFFVSVLVVNVIGALTTATEVLADA